MQGNAFQPLGLTVAIDVTSTSAAFQVPNSGTVKGASQILVNNLSAAVVWIAFGTASSVAAVIPLVGTPANGIPVGPGVIETFSVPSGSDPSGVWLAAIAASAGPFRINVTPGEGV
jgi:hypothetical protein